ncbi:MAG: oligosaccharide flippase family protein [Nitrosomonadales bacterium]|nr:oligosaccharide flippase family protein [Nitrosomonadales bacterium]
MMVPLAVHYLGKEQYGLWVTVSSLLAMLAFMDGGAGNAVINMVAHACGANRRDLPKIVSTAFFSLMVLTLVGSMLFLSVFSFVDWGRLLGASAATSRSDVDIVVLVVGLFFFSNMVLTLVGKVQRGMQEGNLDNIWSGIGALLSLIFVYVAIQEDAGLVGVVVGFLLGVALAYLMSSVHYFVFYRKALFPLWGLADRKIAKNMFGVGGLFLVLQITSTIQGQADNVIIANMLGASEVTNYAVCMKLFVSVSMIFGLVLTPLWPAYREAIASGDMQWTRRVFIRSLKWTLSISVPVAILLVLFGARIIELWVGRNAVPSDSLLLGCGIWMVLLTTGSALAVLLNSLQMLRIQLMVAISAATLNILLTISLIREMGAEGAVWGSIISYLVCSVLPYSFVLRNVFGVNRGEKRFA